MYIFFSPRIIKQRSENIVNYPILWYLQSPDNDNKVNLFVQGSLQHINKDNILPLNTA